MKIYKIILLIFSLFAFSSLTEIYAQENIRELMKKYENSELIEMSVFLRSDPKTNQTSSSQKTIVIKDNNQLIEEFTKALFKDKENANDIREKIDKGVLVSAWYRFSNGKVETTCSFSREYKNVVKITLRENF